MEKYPGDKSLHIKLARVFKDMKRYEDAISEYNKYLFTDSANADVIREKNETQTILNALTQAYILISIPKKVARPKRMNITPET